MKEVSSEFLAKVSAGLDLAVAMKAAMLRDGTSTHEADCPLCGARVRAAIRGPRDHLVLACVTDNCIKVIE